MTLDLEEKKAGDNPLRRVLKMHQIRLAKHFRIIQAPRTSGLVAQGDFLFLSRTGS
jgi:hypothetical protein